MTAAGSLVVMASWFAVLAAYAAMLARSARNE
jgi:hypothetical protein